jgi:hypothetical protein
MRKRRVLVGYGIVFLAAFTFIAFQITHAEHFVGYVSFAPAEPEQVLESEQEEIVLSFGEPLVFGMGTGKNLELFIDYRGQAPLVFCSVFDVSSSSIHISSSHRVSLHSGDKATLPVSIQVPSNFESDARNFSFLFSCEGHQQEYTFPFMMFNELSSSSVLTGLAVQEETKGKLSLFGFVVAGILIVVFVARSFHKKDTHNYVSLDRPRRTLIPLKLS